MDINTYLSIKLRELAKETENLHLNSTFKTIIDFTPNAILIIQNDKIVFANRAALILLNYEEKELLGQKYSLLIHKEDIQVVANRLLNLQKEESNKPQVFKYKPKGSLELFYAETISIAIKLSNVPAALIVSRDVTSEYNIKLKLDENISLLEDTEKITGTGSYKINLNTGKAFWTNGVYRIFNYPKSMDLPTVESYYSLVHPDDRDLLKSELTKSITQNKPFNLKYRIITMEGELKHVHSKSKVINDNGNSFLVGSFVDLSSQVKANQQIKANEEKYKNLISNLPIGIIKFNKEKILFANSSCRKILGDYSENEIESLSFFELLFEIEKDRFNAILKQELDSKLRSNKKYIISLKSKNKENIYVNLNIYEIIKGKQPIYKCYFENITGVVKNYNDAKKLSTDALYISRKIETFEAIKGELESIILRYELDKCIFVELFRIMSNEWSLEQLWAIFQSNFEKVEKGFFKKLKTIAPDLTQQELKHCAFIRMNFETKDIAAMFQVKPSSIQIARVRMKKKFNLRQEDDLINFVITI